MADAERFLRDLVREQTVLLRRFEMLEDRIRHVGDADVRLHLGRAQTVYIAVGVLDVGAHSHYRVGPESGFSDELDTITATHAGHTVVLFPLTDTTITVKNATGNIYTASGSDVALDANHKNVTLLYSSDLGIWMQL